MLFVEHHPLARFYIPFWEPLPHCTLLHTFFGTSTLCTLLYPCWEPPPTCTLLHAFSGNFTFLQAFLCFFEKLRLLVHLCMLFRQPSLPYMIIYASWEPLSPCRLLYSFWEPPPPCVLLYAVFGTSSPSTLLHVL